MEVVNLTRSLISDIPDTRIASKKTLSKDIKLIDLENDGVLEVLVSSFEISLTKIIGALMSGGIRQDFLIFAMDENFDFGAEPLSQKKVKLKFSLSRGQSGFPLIKVADVNGDNIKDLIFFR